MTGNPAGTAVNSLALLVLGAIVSLSSSAFAAQPANPRIAGLQALAVRIKAASDSIEAGRTVDAAALEQFRSSMTALRSSGTGDGDRQFQAKLAATDRLLAKVTWLALKPRDSAHAVENLVLSQHRFAKDAVSDGHGTSCAAAMGLSPALPVKLTLGERGQISSEAWFRLERNSSQMIRLSTDSTGGDPALEIYDSCSAGAVAIAANDDEAGLDAAILGPAGEGPLFVHLANSGTAGEVLLTADVATGSIAGTVVEAGSNKALGGLDVVLFDTYWSSGLRTTTDQAGHYVLPVVAPGSYYVRASGSTHLPAIYPAGTCPYPIDWFSISSCDVTNAQLVVVGDGSNVAAIDFSLVAGRRVAGQVRSTTGEPLDGGVFLYGTGGIQLNFTGTDEFGRYAFSPLPNAQFRLRASVQGYGQQLYNHVDCTGPLKDQCDLGSATYVDVTTGSAINVDFSLPLLASIEGDVFAPGDVPFGGSYSIEVRNAGGSVLSTVGFYGSHYRVGPLAPGTYLLSVVAYEHFSQVYAAVDCDVTCAAAIAAATPVVVQAGQVASADFHLTRLPDVSGEVHDALSQAPLGGSRIYASLTPPSSFGPVRSAIADDSGKYTLSSVPPGTYYLWAQSDDHIDRIYPDIDCERVGFDSTALCNVVGASMLGVAPGIIPGTYDFQLGQAAAISGRTVTRGPAPLDVPAFLAVYAFDGAATLVASANSDAQGNYLIRDLPAGTYYVYAETSYSGSYVPQLWQGMDCFVYCAPTTGSAVIVGQAATVSGIDFSMLQRDAVVGRVTDFKGLPLSGALVDLFDSTTGKYAQTGATNSDGYYLVRGSLNSSYFVATYSGLGYVNQVHAGIACSQGPAYLGLCDFAGATAVLLSADTTQPHVVDFALAVSDRVFSSGFEIP